MFKRIWVNSLFALFALVMGAAVSMHSAGAHDNADLAAHPGPNGGMVQMSGDYHIELLLKPDAVNAWLTDHGDVPQSTEGAAARVTIFGSNGARTSLDLQPADKNAFRASAKLDETKGVRVVVDLTMPGESPVQIRFDIPR
ncbi:hypothetical protein DLM45_14620 [Hyphomicrobium methylovorum]|uniref:hypothetical protein n=1 Tax=Hyphomicrobium methylovorum TaxID=84 RepID=UPI0015E73627|nr:hypothetical protein [Hyphomicrobium methylovorum]MBA2127445.1 hypothetical protein [Hyphomicrobium methylovorum]